MVDNKFGKLIYEGKILDLDNSNSDELKQIINELQLKQVQSKNKIQNILDKMSEEI